MRKLGILAVSLALLTIGTAAFSQDGDEKPKWSDRITMSGDLRLRAETFDWEGKFDDDHRNRFRYRLRFGLGARLSDELEVGLQLRSGNPDNPHSDNQSFDGGFSKKEIALAEAFVDWRPRTYFGLTGGKFSPKKLWLVSDMQWDDDVVTEGLMESFRFDGSGVLKAVHANLYQFILEESGSSSDAYLLGAQVRPVLAFSDKNQLTVGAGYDVISNPDKVADLTLSGELATEPEGIVTNIIVDPASRELASDFNVLSAFAEWKNKSFERWPIKLSLFYYKNLGAEDRVGDIIDSTGATVVGGLNGKDNDTGHFVRLQVGDYKKPGRVAVRVAKYYSEPDAIFYAWVQSDTRRGSNLDGERVDVRIGMPLNGHVNITYYHTDEEVGTDTTMNRWQFDYIFTF